jgi:hypothetical protein
MCSSDNFILLEKYFAMKILEKANIKKESSKRRIKEERKILEIADC